MENIRYVGMDVHKETIYFCVLESHGSKPIFEKEILNEPWRIRKIFESLGDFKSIHSCYEAGCLGYPLHREISTLGVKNIIVAPGLIPRKASDRIKTDRRDAFTLANMLRGGLLEGIFIPTDADEVVRDFLRMREDFKCELTHARQRLSGLLLRHELRYDRGAKNWTLRHFKWLSEIKTESHVFQSVLDEHIIHVTELGLKLKEISNRLVEMALSAPYDRKVKTLMSLKGIDYLGALSLVVEIGDFRRFASAPAFMSFLGLVPKERSSGARKIQSGITKTGNTRLRTLLIEGSWSYRYKSTASAHLAKKRAGLGPSIVAYAEKATKHLEDKYKYLVIELKKDSRVAVTAIARGLAGFVWGVMTENYQ